MQIYAEFLSFFFLSNIRATSAQGTLIDGHKILKCFKIFAYIDFLCNFGRRLAPQFPRKYSRVPQTIRKNERDF